MQKAVFWIFAKIRFMDQNFKEIIVGQGLGRLRFGLSREQVQIALGKPTDVEKYSLDEEEGDHTEAWHYDELDLSLSFDEALDWKLSSIAVSGDGYTLDKVSLIGRGQDEVLDEFDNKDWGDPEEDEEVSQDDPAHQLFFVEESSLSLWFEDGILTEIQWGPHVKDDEVLWPSENA